MPTIVKNVKIEAYHMFIIWGPPKDSMSVRRSPMPPPTVIARSHLNIWARENVSIREIIRTHPKVKNVGIGAPKIRFA